MTKTIAEVEAEIGVIFNPSDGRSWYRLLGNDFGDFDTTCGHYRRTDEDGMLVLLRDDTMTEVRAYPHSPGVLASGWRHVIEVEEGADDQD
jgi:hypothetical protein